MKKMGALLACMAMFASGSLVRGQLKELQMQKVTEHVYILYGNGGNMAFYLTGAGALVVDSGVFPSEGKRAVELVKSVSDKEIKYLVLTHCHDDHINGSGAFPQSVEVLCHENTVDLISGYSKGEIQKTIRDATALVEATRKKVAEAEKSGKECANEKKMINDLQYGIAEFKKVGDVRISRKLTGSETINLDGKEIRLLHSGPAHTAGDLAVYIPSEKILLAGDLVFGGMIPFAREENHADIHNWIAFLKELNKLDIAHVLPGHGALVSKTIMDEQIGYFDSLIDAVTKMMKEGKTREEVQGSIRIARYEKYRGYPQRFRLNAQKIYDELQKKNPSQNTKPNRL
jgi:glyoxylase-like metal-dependent hydrolase (beta-lactamase superfamily II)